MAYKISIPFYAFRIQFQSGDHLLIPRSDQEVLRIGEKFEILAGQYAETLQQYVLNKGHFQKLLNELLAADFQQDTLTVDFPAAKDGVSYPAFALSFNYFFHAHPDGMLGLIPTLGIEVHSKKPEALKNQLQEAVRLNFNRQKRLSALQNVVATIWYEAVEVLREDMELKAPTPAEVEAFDKNEGVPLLPKAAQALEVKKQVAFGMEIWLDQLTRALNSSFNRSVLLVGPSGVGKTALVWELVRQQKKRRLREQIWETTAARLIRALTDDGGAWENNAALFCRELVNSEHILFIRNLAELFEVGQYAGSDVSLADFLRNYISRGEVVILSECSEEELRRIELRSPNFPAFFQIIRLQEPREDLEQIILQKVNSLAAGRAIHIDESAIREVIRLNRRFVPYAGMPGRPIRFLENMLFNQPKPKRPISRAEVIAHFCEETGMPPFIVDPDIPMDPEAVQQQFNASVFGQPKAIEGIVNTLAAVKTALTPTGKPVASFLFVGPTGVGKTELVKVLTQFMFGNSQRMVRFDMSEYADAYNVQRLAGSGYANEDGLLTSAVRRDPFCVLLFDEIEKAHSSFYDLLLPILDEGRLTDHQGKVVNFCSTIIIMTSNIGAQSLQMNPIGWGRKVSAPEVTHHFIKAVQEHFRPELFARIDQVIPFEPLDQPTIRYVVAREIALFRQREGVRYRRMDLHLDPAVIDFLMEKGYHQRYGARYLQRIIRETLTIPLAKALNAYDTADQLSVQVHTDGHHLRLQVEEDPLGLDLMLEELEKIKQSNHASNLRRLIDSLQDGHLYNQLQSELQQLEAEKKHPRFQSNPVKVNRYADFLQIKEQMDNLHEQISYTEQALSLSSLGITPYNPSLYDRMEEWRAQFQHSKLQLYSALRPEHNVCFFAVYGTELTPVIKFYRELFAAKDFRYTAQSVWFRESFYNEIELTGYYNEQDEYVTVRQKRRAYLTQDCVGDAANWFAQPLHKNDLLCGVEFTIFGAAAFLFLFNEAGLQRWKLSDQFDQAYTIIVDNQSFTTPDNIHRRSFYGGQPRRVYDPPSFRDNLYKIKRETRNPLELLLPMLEERFDMCLDEMFY
ncbi:MAG TPA: AAA family ATPase [Saprospiraceae bacterium]|nr:AAA family ATPase [Saprospiraceae bacterium]HMP23323.1 AAA family ATPase [Saprospiraceae bacterium]